MQDAALRKAPVVVIGGGPSARELTLERLWGRAYVIAINDSARRLPWADVVFSADGRWLRMRARFIEDFAGRKIAVIPPWLSPPAIEGIEVVRRMPGVGVSDDREAVYFGDNSGFAALNWASAVLISRRIALVGFDMNGGGWWHSGYEWPVNLKADTQATWADGFAQIASKLRDRGLDIVNVNPRSAIRCFRFASFDSVVEGTAWQ